MYLVPALRQPQAEIPNMDLHATDLIETSDQKEDLHEAGRWRALLVGWPVSPAQLLLLIGGSGEGVHLRSRVPL